MTANLPDPTDPSHPSRQHLGLLTQVLGMVGVGFVWWIAHRHDQWRPLLGDFVTEDFADALWAIEWSLRVQFAGHALLVLARPAWARRLFELVQGVLALVVVAAFLAVFPFDTQAVHPMLEPALRLGLVALGIALSIAATMSFGRLILPPDDAPAS